MNPLTKASTTDEVSQREEENREIAYRAACEGIVLLRNNGTLPLPAGGKIALYGSGAAMTIKGGSGSGEVNERHAVSFLEGLEASGFQITSQPWLMNFLDSFDAAKKQHRKDRLKNWNPLTQGITDLFFDDFQAPSGVVVTQTDVNASGTDTCIYVISRRTGEGRDHRAEKGDLFLTAEEEESIRFCAQQYEKFILVINSGAAIDMSFTDRIPGINAILFTCLLGQEGGRAFADVLSGAVSPSGKLADTWAKRYEDIPFYDEYSYLNGELDH